ncbi:MAG TPA: ATP-binding protein [Polyangiaceae bacterium]|nr:ATP-binding protein [Polyangiaceae bacterium]
MWPVETKEGSVVLSIGTGSVPPPTQAHAPGIRRYLLAFLSVLTAIPVLWLGQSYATHTADSDRRGHDQALTSLASGVARQLDMMLESRCRDLEVLAGGLQVLGELDGPRVQAMMSEHLDRSRYFTGTYVADAAGNSLVRAPSRNPDGSPAQPGNYRDRDYYQELVRTQRTSISRVQLGRVTHAVNIQIATPVFSTDRKLVGYVEGSVELDTFGTLVRNAAAQLGGSRVVVLDSSSRVVADSSASDHAGIERLSSAPVFARQPSRPLLTSEPDEHGEVMRAALEPGGSLLPRWRVVAAESQQRIDENARRTRDQTWVTAAALWLVVFLLAVAVTDRFGRRLAELAATVSAIGRGDFERRARPSGRWEPREFAVLNTQIGAMAERLSHQRRELEVAVRDRTAELAEVNERLTILVDALERADDGIEITGPDARFIYVNPAYQRITGYSAAELVGKKPAMLRSTAHDASFYDAIWQRVSSGQVYSGVLVGRRKDGTHFDQELTVWPIVERSGAITHFVGLRRDVTERRRTEHALRVSERMASVGTLAAGVAHEINNPLTYVLLNLNYLRDQVVEARHGGRANGERMELAVDRALEGAERVSAIVKDLRTLSRPDDRSIKPLQPCALVASALRMVGNDIRHKATLVEDIQPVPYVLGNEAQLSQVFLNLLVNALQSLEDDVARPAEIGVRIGTDELGRVVVEVTDTGCGIPREHLHRIFDPFFTTKPVGLGTGIGLALCHSTVKAMNGEILVESTVGAGSRFRVILPSLPDDMAFTPSEPISTQTARRTVPPQRVLVMDDDRAVGEALLQGLGQHDVTVVGSAEAGLEAVKAGTFNLILCDVMMPVMTGIDFYQRLSEVDPAQLDRVVFITGGVLTDSARSFLDRHAVSCLEKPVSIEQLEAVVARFADDSKSAREAPRAERLA